MDHFERIENILHESRLAKAITPRKLTEEGFTAPTVYRIEKHGNYSICTLFRLLSMFALTMTVDGRDARTVEELGGVLREIRLEKKLSQLDIIYKNKKLTSSRIVAVENGRDYEKKTLNSYLDALDVTIGIRT